MIDDYRSQATAKEGQISAALGQEFPAGVRNA
jgi:hypothetical protein